MVLSRSNQQTGDLDGFEDSTGLLQSTSLGGEGKTREAWPSGDSFPQFLDLNFEFMGPMERVCQADVP